MTTRTTAPVGAPCWVDLWTSDVDGSRRFYAELFGWEAQEADPTHGGYFMFTRDGLPVAGGMGPMADQPADDRWKPYLCTDDIEAATARVSAAGGQVAMPPMAVDQLGFQSVVVDPTGAPVGLWQPGEFRGFSVLNEEAAPSWFELHTADHPAAVAFYREVFGLELVPVSDTDDFRYWTFRAPGTGTDLGGIMDSRAWVAPGAASWSVYWEVADIEGALDRVKELGGAVGRGPDDTPWGRLAEATDPAGAPFKLRTSPPA